MPSSPVADRLGDAYGIGGEPGGAARVVGGHRPRDAGQSYCLPVFVADQLGGAQRIGKDGLPRPGGLSRPNLHTGAVIARRRDGGRGEGSRADRAFTGDRRTGTAIRRKPTQKMTDGTAIQLVGHHQRN